MKEVMRNKREFNARVRQLEKEGYRKYGEYRNSHGFVKNVDLGKELTVDLIQAWKKGGI